MSDPVSAAGVADTPAPRDPVLARVSRFVGEVFVTIGLLLLLFVGYQLWWTNVTAERAAAATTDDLLDSWSGDPEPMPEYDRPLRRGEAFAVLRIPRLGQGFRTPVIQGVGLDVLARGVGHYPGTALPGKVGNFAVAGHRATNGEPFRDLDRLRAGDAVVVETRTTWYVYRVTAAEIVLPTQVDVLLPVPRQPDVAPVDPVLTLTTCNPRWASTERLIVYGELEQTQPKADGPPSALDTER